MQRLPPSSIVKKTQALKIVGITTIDLAGVVHKVFFMSNDDGQLHVEVVAAVAMAHHKELIYKSETVHSRPSH